MNKPQQILLLFPSIHYVLEAESLLQSIGRSFLVIPVSPAISQGCGMGIRIEEQDQPEIEMLLAKHHLDPIQKVVLHEISPRQK